MSNRSRLILLSGTTAEAASALAESTAASLAGCDHRVLKLSMRRRGPYGVIDGGIVSALGHGIERLLVDAGADQLPLEIADGLPGIRELSLLDHIVGGLADPAIDVIVVDCGDLDRALSLIEIPSDLLTLLDSLLTARLAMWRGVTQGDGATVFEELSVARASVARAIRVLRHSQTSLRIAMEHGEQSRVVSAIATIAVLGVPVDGVCIRGTRQGKKQTKALRSSARKVSATGATVWVSKSGDRPAPRRNRTLEVLPHSTVVGDEFLLIGDYAIAVRLIGPARKRARIGRLGEALLIDFAGVRRQLVLPPALSRCRVVDAWRDAEGIQMTFEPDEALWPKAAS